MNKTVLNFSAVLALTALVSCQNNTSTPYGMTVNQSNAAPAEHHTEHARVAPNATMSETNYGMDTAWMQARNGKGTTGASHSNTIEIEVVPVDGHRSSHGEHEVEPEPIRE